MQSMWSLYGVYVMWRFGARWNCHSDRKISIFVFRSAARKKPIAHLHNELIIANMRMPSRKRWLMSTSEHGAPMASMPIGCPSSSSKVQTPNQLLPLPELARISIIEILDRQIIGYWLTGCPMINRTIMVTSVIHDRLTVLCLQFDLVCAGVRSTEALRYQSPSAGVFGRFVRMASITTWISVEPKVKQPSKTTGFSNERNAFQISMWRIHTLNPRHRQRHFVFEWPFNDHLAVTSS